MKVINERDMGLILGLITTKNNTWVDDNKPQLMYLTNKFNKIHLRKMDFIKYILLNFRLYLIIPVNFCIFSW